METLELSKDDFDKLKRKIESDLPTLAPRYPSYIPAGDLKARTILFKMFPQWKNFILDFSSHFISAFGELKVYEKFGLDFYKKQIVRWESDKGRDVLIDNKWWDVKTGVVIQKPNENYEPATFQKREKTSLADGYIFCAWQPPNLIYLIQANLRTEMTLKLKGSPKKCFGTWFDDSLVADMNLSFDFNNYFKASKHG